MKRLLGFTLGLFALVSARAAESPAERGKRVVDEALRALGGGAFLKMEDRLETGRAYSFYGSELSGLSVAKIYTRYPAASEAREPGKVQTRERQAFFTKAGRKEELAAIVFNPDGAWQLTYRGAVPLEDERLENYRNATRKNILYILRCRLGEPGLEFYSRGSDRYENQAVEVVEITDASGDLVTVFFSQAEKLPVREQYKRKNPLYKDFDSEAVTFGKYRDIGGGVKWPFEVRRERNGEKIYQMFSDSVEINQNLTDDLFAIPVKMKVLPKPK